jgi:ABC-2 type transport system ATP-binding protein
MTNLATQVEGLHKAFGAVIAIDHLDFQVGCGEIFGLLGPNGAGKTTTIRILMDILKADAGTVRVLDGAPAAMRERVGYLPEERGLYRSLRLDETLVYLGQLKGMPASRARKRAFALLEQVGLAEWSRKRVQELSRGMHQKLQIIASIIHDPDLVMLDEPFQGLDPVNVEIVKELIRDLRAHGKTILLSAHEMSQVEALCERILLIHRGRAVLYGALTDIKKQFAPNAIEISPPLDWQGWVEVARVQARDRKQIVHLQPNIAPRDFLRKILEQGLFIEQFEIATMPLEQIFVAVVKGD